MTIANWMRSPRGLAPDQSTVRRGHLERKPKDRLLIGVLVLYIVVMIPECINAAHSYAAWLGLIR